MEDLSPLVRAIKEEMLRREMTVEELADKAGITRQAVYLIWKGTPPRLPTLQALADALGIQLIAVKP